MFNATFRRMILIAVMLIAVFGATSRTVSASPSGDMSPIQIQFDKQGGVNGIWHGAVTGDVEGSLTTELLSATQAGPILKVTFAWIVEAGDHSFTAVLNGTLNTMTGKVEMDGTVVEGWLVGAQVHEEGQLVDPLLGRFQGTINIFPATAD